METLQWNSFVLLYWDDHVGSTESKYRCEPHWSDQTVTLFFFFSVVYARACCIFVTG